MKIHSFESLKNALPAAAVAALALSFSPPVPAVVRITEGTFDRCFYGNRGGSCFFRDADGKEHDVGMPTDDRKRKNQVIWIIDGKAVGYVPMDGGFSVPDHPAFAEDHAESFDRGHHPFAGCKIRMIEKPGATQLELDTRQCR